MAQFDSGVLLQSTLTLTKEGRLKPKIRFQTTSFQTRIRQ
ncbi:hypothetical protein NEISICOT_00460 [Neisseria sicca ATCC 29256]|uniref:Uncharacterized protein n=1 Tax=Neisseria sicca ATCC 29256 TaxID=547045 RepID=C6M1S4_NEISI|nr:hypothetical protein NEISICOT_00460 [Neisseria sicca ATCC 29256]